MNRTIRAIYRTIAIATILMSITALPFMALARAEAPAPRLSMFVGLDVSGSFMNSKYYDDALEFLAHYLYAHLKGTKGTEVPRVLFVGSLGGSTRNEPKTFFPIQTFEGKTVKEIHSKLIEIFPKKVNPYTDFNAFFEQVANIVRTKGLVLRPISIVLLTDGEPDFPRPQGKVSHNVAEISIKDLELLSRNITIRVLYASAPVAIEWQKKVRRQRVKLWTQDAPVMEQWKDPQILNSRFPEWLKDNVDFPVRLRRVD